jgi:antitoxin YefM
MHAITYSSARQHLAEIMNKVCDEHEPILITRTKAKTTVLISLEDFHSMKETAYLLQSPKNAKHLQESMEQFEKGEYKEMVLVE